jgi:hypothetical protein
MGVHRFGSSEFGEFSVLGVQGSGSSAFREFRVQGSESSRFWEFREFREFSVERAPTVNGKRRFFLSTPPNGER